jgi:DNA-directed RNA polymerase specialized sigma24 family protein
MTWKDFEAEPTEDLIAYIQLQKDLDFLESSKLAFHAFCFRFYEEFNKICSVLAKKWDYDNDFGDELADKAFNKFWKYPNSFTPSECKSKLDRCVILYLSRIAQNLLIDKKREENSNNPYNGTEDVLHELPDIHLVNSLEKRKELRRVHDIIEEAFKRLTPKHKIIYLTYKAHEKDGYKLPRQLLKELRDELDLTQDSVRVYKNQAFEKVNEYLKLYGTK